MGQTLGQDFRTLSLFIFYVLPLGRICKATQKWLEPLKNRALLPVRGVVDCTEIGKVEREVLREIVAKN